MKVLDSIAEQHDHIVKEAIVGAASLLLRGALGTAKYVVKNPLKSLGAVMTASDLGEGSRRFSNITAANRANPYRPPVV